MKEKEVKKVLYRSVGLVKAVVWYKRWFNLALACTLNLKAPVTIAEAKVKSLMRRTSVRFAMGKR